MGVSPENNRRLPVPEGVPSSHSAVNLAWAAEALSPRVSLQLLGRLLHLRHLVWAGSFRLHGTHLPRWVSVGISPGGMGSSQRDALFEGEGIFIQCLILGVFLPF